MRNKKYIVIILLMIMIVMGSVFFLTMEGSKNRMTDTEKYNDYVEFNNQIVKVIEYSIRAYVKEFGFEETINTEKFDGFGVNPVIEGFYKDCSSVVENSKKKPQYEGLDEVAVEMSDETVKMYDLVNDMADYYNNHKYEEDNFVKGQELHTRFVELTPSFLITFSDYVQELSSLEVKQLEKTLDKFDNGKNDYEYYALKCIIQGQKISDYFYENDIYDDNVLDINKDQYDKLYNELKEAYEGFYKAKEEANSEEFRVEVMEEYIAAMAGNSTNIKTMIDEQTIDIDIPKSNAVTTGEVLPISTFKSLLSTSISYYNNR